MSTPAVKTLPELDLQRQIELLKWRHGGPRGMWEMKAPLVEKLIKESKLQSMTADWSVRMPKVLPTWEGGCGGIRLPHFHLRGDIYAATPDAWHAFTNEILKEASARLDEMKRQQTVTFEDTAKMMELVSH